LLKTPAAETPKAEEATPEAVAENVGLSNISQKESENVSP
jgi:hypothetical protein